MSATTSTNPTLMAQLEAAATEVRNRAPGGFFDAPQNLSSLVGIVLGSGLGSYQERLSNRVVIPYREIPYFLGPTVEGHAGQMVLGTINDSNLHSSIPVVALNGRIHFYEGHSPEEVVFPIRVLAHLGVRTVLLTNASGGLNPSFRETDLMLITDQLNLTGNSPLRGSLPREIGPRFLDMTELYPTWAQKVVLDAAAKQQLMIRQGVYVGLPGPAYETPAEVRMLQRLGGDAVGMSTVHEATAAHHMGVSVVGIACITNLGAGITGQRLTHSEVIENANKAVAKLLPLLDLVLPQLSHKNPAITKESNR